jgi:hypothetical protein
MVSSTLGYKYYYNDFGESTGRVTFAQNVTDATANLDRTQTASSGDHFYEYDVAGASPSRTRVRRRGRRRARGRGV